MTPPPAGTSPLIWLLAVVLVAFITGALAMGAAWIANRPVRRQLGEVARNARVAAEDARVARTHTENEHKDAEYPNLRDELTAARQAAERAVELAEALAEGQKRHDAEIGGVRSDIRRDRDDTARVADRLDGLAAETRREYRAHALRLDEHLEDARERDDRLEERLDRIENQQH